MPQKYEGDEVEVRSILKKIFFATLTSPEIQVD
jgi:hypothetical protein